MQPNRGQGPNLKGASFQTEGRRMLRLIEGDSASTGELHLRDGTPRSFPNLRELDVLFREGSHLGFQVVAHQIELVNTILIGRMERGFCRRQGENQPASARIHGFESENIAEKCAVRLRLFAENNYVSARNHLPLRRTGRDPGRMHVGWNLETIKLQFGDYLSEAKRKQSNFTASR